TSMPRLSERYEVNGSSASARSSPSGEGTRDGEMASGQSPPAASASALESPEQPDNRRTETASMLMVVRGVLRMGMLPFRKCGNCVGVVSRLSSPGLNIGCEVFQ